MNSLNVTNCSYEAARYAVTNWHYSRTLPVGKLYRVGVWEDGRFIGAVLFSWGANMNLGRPYGLDMTECVELVRIALRDHVVPVSQVVAKSLSLLKQDNPGLRLVVSFADPYHKHHGGIYQAGNWVYTGQSPSKTEYLHNGQLLNRRAYTGPNFGKPRASLPVGAEAIEVPGKHRYLYPLDRQTRRKIDLLRLPYPRGASVESDTPSFRDGKPSATLGHRSTSMEDT